MPDKTLSAKLWDDHLVYTKDDGSALTLLHTDKIKNYETERAKRATWLFKQV
jgi:hypothetical protein